MLELILANLLSYIIVGLLSWLGGIFTKCLTSVITDWVRSVISRKKRVKPFVEFKKRGYIEEGFIDYCKRCVIEKNAFICHTRHESQFKFDNRESEKEIFVCRYHSEMKHLKMIKKAYDKNDRETFELTESFKEWLIKSA